MSVGVGVMEEHASHKKKISGYGDEDLLDGFNELESLDEASNQNHMDNAADSNIYTVSGMPGSVPMASHMSVQNAPSQMMNPSSQPPPHQASGQSQPSQQMQQSQHSAYQQQQGQTPMLAELLQSQPSSNLNSPRQASFNNTYQQRTNMPRMVANAGNGGGPGMMPQQQMMSRPSMPMNMRANMVPQMAGGQMFDQGYAMSNQQGPMQPQNAQQPQVPPQQGQQGMSYQYPPGPVQNQIRQMTRMSVRGMQPHQIPQGQNRRGDIAKTVTMQRTMYQPQQIAGQQISSQQQYDPHFVNGTASNGPVHAGTRPQSANMQDANGSQPPQPQMQAQPPQQQGGQPHFVQVSQSGQFQGNQQGYMMTNSSQMQNGGQQRGGMNYHTNQIPQQQQFPIRDGQQPMQQSPGPQGVSGPQMNGVRPMGPHNAQMVGNMTHRGQPPVNSMMPASSSVPSSMISGSPGNSDTLSNVTAQLNGGACSTQDPEKRKMIQQQLVLLLHAHKCQQREKEENGRTVQSCNLPHCRMMKTVLDHMTNCQSGRQCSVPHCASSRQIIAHWKNCIKDDCPVCKPLKNFTRSTNFESPGPNVPDNYPDNAFNYSNPPNRNVVQPVSQPGQQFSGGNEGYSIPPPDPPTQMKPWHSTITTDLRNHLVSKLVKTIFPSPDPAAVRDQRLKDLLSYARKVEKEMFEVATDKEEYYHLLAEKIYKIQKELQEKKNRRMESSQRDGEPRPSFPQYQLQSTEAIKAEMRQGMPPEIAPESSPLPNSTLPPADVEMTSAEVKQEPPDAVVESQEPTEFPTTSSPEKRSALPTPAPTPNPAASTAPPQAAVESSVSDKKKTRYPVHTYTMDPEELREHFLGVWRACDYIEEALPFRIPVNPEQLNIPDYFDVIKKPMDLQTIRDRLDAHFYKEPRTFCDDFWLMFENAWLYNRKTSKVYKYCTKLSEVFANHMNPVMEKLGFCCSYKYPFTPLSLFCFGTSMCLIARDQQYYLYDASSSKFGVNVSERYIYCTKCFENLPPEGINLNENPDDPPNFASKDKFQLMKNDIIHFEPLEKCVVCSREVHRICANYNKKVYPDGFVCQTCQKSYDIKIPENRFTAKKLSHCKLSTHIETRVNDFIVRRAAQLSCTPHEVVIRVLCSTDKEVEVKSNMKDKYLTQGFPEKFPYRTKAVFAFEIIDNVEVCFFGLHVQEYGSECKSPNKRRVYIAYLDSVHFFQPRELRTDVYHEILLAYLQYVRDQGYVMAHIWACPPSEGDDYIFHCHPPEQKIPKPKRLQDWYKKMLDKGVQERIVVEYKDIYKQAKDDNLQSPMELPYFEGDFWPNIIEDIIREVDKEERERKRQEDALGTNDEEDEVCSMDDTKMRRPGDVQAKAKKKLKKISKKKKGSIGNEITDKLLSTLEKHKEVFFTIRLRSVSDEQKNESIPITDADPLMPSELMDGRDTFLNKARDEHWEFSSMRRAKYSTLCFCHALHNQESKDMTYSCNTCSANANWHCGQCDDFDLCDSCHSQVKHEHRLEKINSIIDVEKGNDPQHTRNESIARCIQSLVHACQCRDANCRRATCHKMKKVVQHTKLCKKRQQTNCPVCKQLIALCCYHAKHCNQKQCAVPFCSNIRQKLQEQKRLQNRRADMLMRRRMDKLQSTNSGGMPPVQASMGQMQGGSQQQQLMAQMQQQQQHQAQAQAQMRSQHSMDKPSTSGQQYSGQQQPVSGQNFSQQQFQHVAQTQQSGSGQPMHVRQQQQMNSRMVYMSPQGGSQEQYMQQQQQQQHPQQQRYVMQTQSQHQQSSQQGFAQMAQPGSVGIPAAKRPRFVVASSPGVMSQQQQSPGPGMMQSNSRGNFRPGMYGKSNGPTNPGQYQQQPSGYK